MFDLKALRQSVMGLGQREGRDGPDQAACPDEVNLLS